MSTVGTRRIRAIAPAPRSAWERTIRGLASRESRTRTAIASLATLVMWIGTQGWAPPFPFRLGETPARDLVARVDFAVADEGATRNARYEARRMTPCVYVNRPQLLVELRESLIDSVLAVKGATDFESMDIAIWNPFLESGDMATPRLGGGLAEFDAFRKALAGDGDLAKLKRALDTALAEYDRDGLLRTLTHSQGEGPSSEIQVVRVDSSEPGRIVATSLVRIDEVLETLPSKLRAALASEFTEEPSAVLSSHLFTWLRTRLPETLSYDPIATEKARLAAERQVATVERQFNAGDRLEWRLSETAAPQWIRGGVPLGPVDLALLHAEHDAYLDAMSPSERLFHSLADLGMFAAVFLLCGAYLYFREPAIFADIPKVAALVGMFTGTVVIVHLVSRDDWRGELIPILLFTMVVSIAYRHELALMLSAAVALVCVFSIGQGLPELVVMVATSATASFFCGAIRSRTRLVYVGLAASAIATPTALGVQILSGEPMFVEWIEGGLSLNVALLRNSLWFGLSAILGAFAMAALLPFVESTFNIQTDMRLLELGVPSHPLLQSLILRAPGTYNHSINVASLAEEAAKQIGANSLLCRVGAYFHDIGKMCKPEYFVENQTDGNKHQSLNPQMSTLIILSHVKDGIELAREHRLPQRIIDFIEQHHGTTLVEYFFEAAKRQTIEAGGNASDVNQGNFRYPGPKPQSKETAVLMLADACESASRTLVDPAPARIEHLVREISRKKLYDGQFDECSLTLRELKLIENSLIKTINAMFHARVRYPEPSAGS